LFSLERSQSPLNIIRTLRATKWDIAIDLFGNPRSALLTFLSGARMRIGGDFRGRRLYYTHRITDSKQRKTAIQFHMNYLAPLGIDVPPVEKKFDLNHPIAGIQAGATWPAKRWLPERFAALADQLSKQVQVLFTMGPGEEAVISNVFKATAHSYTMPEVLPVRQLAAVIQQLRLFISNDCGPMHIAPAVGTPTIGIFGPGEPDIWFPYAAQKGHRLVYQGIDCSMCHRDLCSKMDCMKAIAVEDVLRPALEILQKEGNYVSTLPGD
jgi:ADP-heptose:LPS heptosyltransferase